MITIGRMLGGGMFGLEDGAPSTVQQRLTITLSATSIFAFLNINYTLSYAVLLFGNFPSAAQASGLLSILASGVIMAVVAVLCSSRPFLMIVTDGTLVATLASTVVVIEADMRGDPATAVVATVLAGIVIAGVCTGASLIALGRLHAGGLVRSLPIQVAAGFLAASGWFLLIGGVGISIHRAAAIDVFTDVNALARLGPAVLAGAAFFVVSRRVRSPAALPLTMLLVIVLHHAVMFAAGQTIAEQQAAGWLVRPLHLQGVRPSLAFLAPGAVSWHELARHADVVLALVLQSSTSALLALTGIETATGRELNVDRDLQANGLGSIVSGLVGGVPGTSSLSRTVMLLELGGSGWLPSLLGSAFALAAPLLWPDVIGLIPRSLVGGLLIFIGAWMLDQWVLRTRHHMSRLEWGLVLIVLAISAAFGLVVGVFAGLLLGCIGFVVTYARLSPIRLRYGGGAVRSNVKRPDIEEAILTAQPNAVLVLHLRGFLFFGRSAQVLRSAQEEMRRRRGALRCLVIDFGEVDGADGSAVEHMRRLRTAALADGVALVLSRAPAALMPRLANAGFGAAGRTITTDSLDQALQWAEDLVLSDRRSAQCDVAAAEDDGLIGAVRDLCQVEHLSRGKVLIRQGEPSHSLFFLAGGRVRILVRDERARQHRVRSCGAGVMLGEISFMLDAPATATVEAEEDCTVLRLSREAYDALKTAHPSDAVWLQELLMQRLCDRILDKDELIAALAVGRPRSARSPVAGT